VTVDRCVILRCCHDTRQLLLALAAAEEKQPTSQTLALKHRTKSARVVNQNTGWTNETRG
jgi:hypothetical protein